MVLNPFSAFGGNDAPPQQGDDAVVRPPPGALHVGEPADVLDRLPAEAQDALTGLREKVDDLRVALDHLRSKRNDAWKARSEAETNYRTLTDVRTASRYGRTGVVAEDDPLAVAAKAKLDKTASAARAAQEKYDAAASRWQAQKRLLTNTESYVATAGNLSMAPAPKIKFPSVDHLSGEIERIRNDIAELRAERHATTSAAYPASEAKARAKAEIEMLADRGKPRVTQLIDHGPAAGVGWPHLIAKSSIHGMATPLPGDEARTAHDLPGAHLALTAWLFKDRIIEAIEAEIDSIAEDEAALSTEARDEKLLDLDSKILEAQRIECMLIRNSGGSVDFREDADPRAVLGVDGPPPQED